MRKSKFTEEQIIGFLKQAEAGMAVAEIHRVDAFRRTLHASSRRSCPSLGLMSRTHQIAMLRREEAVPGTLTRTERYAESGDAICTLEPRFESEVLVAQASDFFDALVQLRTQLEKQDLLIRVNGASKIDIFAAEPDLAPSSIVEQERYRDEWFSSLGRET